MSPETLLVTIYFLLPGLVTLGVFEWVFVGRERQGVELVSWAVGVSILAAVPLLLIPQTQPLISYLWEPSALTRLSLLGVLLHVSTGALLALVTGGFVSKVLSGRLGPKTFYQRSWDWLWDQFGSDPRYILVTTGSELIFGQLAFADDPAKGSDVVLVDPSRWDAEKGGFFRSGMKYVWVPGREIKRIEVSVADPPRATDYPYYGAGYVDDVLPIEKEATRGRGISTAPEGQEGHQ